MKKAIRSAVMVLAGVSMILMAGSAVAGDMVNIGGVLISKADYQDIRSMVAGHPSGNRVYADKAESVNVGPIEVARSEFENVKEIVAGKASVADGRVYAQSPKMIGVGQVAVSEAEYQAVKEKISGGPVVRLAQRISRAVDMN